LEAGEVEEEWGWGSKKIGIVEVGRGVKFKIMGVGSGGLGLCEGALFWPIS